MGANNTTIVNKFGKLQGWNSVTLNVLGRDVEGIVEVKYGNSKDREWEYGDGDQPIGYSEKNKKAEFEMTLYKEEIDALQQALAEGQDITDIEPFPVIAQYEKKDGAIQRDRINNVMFTDNMRELKQGEGKILVKCKMMASHVNYNV